MIKKNLMDKNVEMDIVNVLTLADKLGLILIVMFVFRYNFNPIG